MVTSPTVDDDCYYEEDEGDSEEFSAFNIMKRIGLLFVSEAEDHLCVFLRKNWDWRVRVEKEWITDTSFSFEVTMAGPADAVISNHGRVPASHVLFGDCATFVTVPAPSDRVFRLTKEANQPAPTMVLSDHDGKGLDSPPRHTSCWLVWRLYFFDKPQPDVGPDLAIVL